MLKKGIIAVLLMLPLLAVPVASEAGTAQTGFVEQAESLDVPSQYEESSRARDWRKRRQARKDRQESARAQYLRRVAMARINGGQSSSHDRGSYTTVCVNYQVVGYIATSYLHCFEVSLNKYKRSTWRKYIRRAEAHMKWLCQSDLRPCAHRAN